MSNSQVVWMDWRCNEDLYSPKELIEIMRSEASEWKFQLERGEQTGYVHYQGRVRLIKKTRCSTWGRRWGFNYVRPTNENAQGNWDYVTKEDTRIEGPWSWDDKRLPRDVAKVEKLHAWQEELKDIAAVYEERKIHVVVDTRGNNGKTLFTRWMMCHGKAQLIPFCNDFKDIMRMVMDMPKSPCYIMDMPRAIKKEKLYQLWSGIEMVKNGYAYDDRYSFKQELFDPPNIIVFMNNEPDISLLSRDRWKFWEIGEEMELKKRKKILFCADAGETKKVSNMILSSGSDGPEPTFTGIPISQGLRR